MLIAGIAFFLACAGIVGLFALKRWEQGHQQVLLPGVRRGADQKAASLKSALLAGSNDLERLPPLLLRLASLIVRILAIGFGHLAHWVGERSHALADLVSYKHRFERKETRSEFLKQVTEHPITNRPSVPLEVIPQVPPSTPVATSVLDVQPEEKEAVQISMNPVSRVRKGLKRVGLGIRKSRKKKHLAVETEKEVAIKVEEE